MWGVNPSGGEIFSYLFRAAMRPNQLLVQWALGVFAGDKVAGTQSSPPTPPNVQVKESVQL